jgi:hypothetical protein
LVPELGRLLTPQRIRRYPALLLAVTVGIYVVGLARSSHWIEPDGRIVGHDYFAFYMAGDFVKQDMTHRLYDLASQSEYQRQWMADVNPDWQGTCLYLNPPHYAWVMSGFARLEYGPSLVTWWGLCLVAFAVTVTLWKQWLEPASAATAILLAICMPAWFWTLAGGQNSFFSLLILTAFCALLTTRRDVAAGVVLALLGYKFQLVLLAAAVLVLKRRWRGVAGFALGGLATLGLTGIVLGPAALTDYLAFGSRLGQLMHVEGFDVSNQHSWHGFFALLGQGWLSPGQARLLAIAATVLSLWPLCAIWKGPWLPGSSRFALQLSALMMATLLVSPHLFHYDMLLAILPAMLWYRAAVRESAPAGDHLFRAWLAIGFIWLTVSPVIVSVLHVQCSPLIMLAWILAIRRAVAPSAQRAPAGTPHPAP